MFTHIACSSSCQLFSLRVLRYKGYGLRYKALALRKSTKKARNDGRVSSKENQLKECTDSSNKAPPVDSNTSYSGNVSAKGPTLLPNRGAVLQACIITSGLLLGLGAVIRQVSHIALLEGWTTIDSFAVSFGFETQHIEWILGLVILISSSRYILLKIWPDFSESSGAANQQILSCLQPMDYVVVAFLPGITEELLFRGALLPLFGLDWKSALLTGALFGGLHFGGGRRYSYVLWATLVGFVYGLATVSTSSVIVPMAAHSLNNLIGGLLWRFRSPPQEPNQLY